MTPGTIISYADFQGTVVHPSQYPKTAQPGFIYIITQDQFLVGVPAQSPKLEVIKSLSPLTDDEIAEAIKAGCPLKPPVKEQPKLLLGNKFVRMPESKIQRIPAGLYKIVMDGSDCDREEVDEAIREYRYKSDTHRLVVIQVPDVSGYFVIEVPKQKR